MTDEIPEFANALNLVIDDEDTQRLLTRDCLEDEGFKVE
jgi:CheY-like chemotaxis protein